MVRIFIGLSADTRKVLPANIQRTCLEADHDREEDKKIRFPRPIHPSIRWGTNRLQLSVIKWSDSRMPMPAGWPPIIQLPRMGRLPSRSGRGKYRWKMK